MIGGYLDAFFRDFGIRFAVMMVMEFYGCSGEGSPTGGESP